MTHGFLTIATGDEQDYGFAAAGQKFTSLCRRAKNKIKRTLHCA